MTAARKQVQAKHVDERPILEFLAKSERWTSHWESKDREWSFRHLVSAEIPERVLLAKMSALLRRGLVDGCDCGCRGDWVITDKGREALRA